MKKIITIVIILVIFAVSAYLIVKLRPAKTTSPVEIHEPLALDRSEEWLGVYIQGQRVGYSFTKILRADSGLVVENRTQMTLLLMNEVRTLTTHLFAHTDQDYALKDFSLELATIGHPTKIEGVIQGNQLLLTSYSQGNPYTQTITLQEKPYFPDALEEVIKKKKLKPGDEMNIPYFDPTTQSSAIAHIRVFEKEKVQVLDRELTGLKVEIDYMGITSIFWLDDNYHLMKESSPGMGIEMIPLTQEQALAEVQPQDAFNLLPFFAVKLDQPIPDPTSLTYLKIELKDITIDGLDLEDDFQKLFRNDKIIIESDRANLEELASMSIPINEQPMYLEPSAYIQSQDPEIIRQARAFIGDATSAQEAVGRLVSGVYNYLEKNPTASLPSAIDVLKTKEGDCNEHSILFAALARSIGIPTKIYVGLVNLEGKAYYYHAWCAVWLGKWVAVDPTFNQYPADVGHLKLKEGEIAEQARVLKVVGKLRIAALDYR